MNELFLVSNDKFFLKKKDLYNSNKNTFTVINCFKNLKRVSLIARTTNKKLKFSNKINNIKIINFLKIFKIKNQFKQKKTLVISLTPYNFLIVCTLLILGIKKKNIYLYLRSDGFQEYSIKFGIAGKIIYNLMLNLLKKRLNILSCSSSLKGIGKSKLIYESAITSKWLDNRKKQVKKLNLNKKIKFLYIGRLREEKGYNDLIELFNQLKIKSSLTIIGNDFRYLKKKDYPKNSNIRIIGQISSENKLINYYNKSDIFILPSYSEAFPQVILESFSRLKPVIIFNEIGFLKKVFPNGLFNCERKIEDFETTIKKIVKKYKNVQLTILKSKIYTFKDFQIQMKKII